MFIISRGIICLVCASLLTGCIISLSIVVKRKGVEMARSRLFVCFVVFLFAALAAGPAWGAKGGKTGPVSTVSSPAYSTDQTSSKKFRVSWSAPSAVAFDLQYQVGSSGIWSTQLAGTTATSTVFTGVPGNTYRFRARGKNNSGSYGQWSSQKTTVVPHNQSAAVYTGIWRTTPRNAGYYLRTTKFASRRRARAVYSFTGARELALIITKRPKGGLADVYVNGVKTTTVDFYSPVVVKRAPVLISTFSAATSGRLKVVVKHTKNTVSAGYRVELDGFAKKN